MLKSWKITFKLYWGKYTQAIEENIPSKKFFIKSQYPDLSNSTDALIGLNQQTAIKSKSGKWSKRWTRVFNKCFKLIIISEILILYIAVVSSFTLTMDRRQSPWASVDRLVIYYSYWTFFALVWRFRDRWTKIKMNKGDLFCNKRLTKILDLTITKNFKFIV